ncbi:MAG: secondary thiamine-phosphate synthase enzyme YjbQ [Candidatus Aerophobetes bacterium]|nr:secondary thiamine-phosphate synthase enzyme YjbQ [Candidatus Aerophobetes bacterium]
MKTLKRLSITTNSKTEFINTTSRVEKEVRESRVKEGICYLYVPHTTAGITINEGADPDVGKDILNQLNNIVPSHGNYSHREGNSPAHIKSSLIGCSETLLIHNNQLILGTWQSIYFCEFDGPRDRELIIKIEQI